MIEPLRQLSKLGSMEVMCNELGNYLGIGKPVPRAVLRRARNDDRFAQYVFTCRNRPHLLDKLFNDKRNRVYEKDDDTTKKPVSQTAQAAKAPTNRELVGKAAGAIWKWAKSGFENVDKETLDRRLAACHSCEHLTDPPDKLAYRVKLHAGSDQRICGACSCVVASKARLATESCPIAHAEESGFTRWMEPLTV